MELGVMDDSQPGNVSRIQLQPLTSMISPLCGSTIMRQFWIYDLLELKASPVRVARVMVRYKDQIIEPDNDRLLSIGRKSKMDVFPMAVPCVLLRHRAPFYQLVKQLVIVHKHL